MLREEAHFFRIHAAKSFDVAINVQQKLSLATSNTRSHAKAPSALGKPFLRNEPTLDQPR